MWRPFVIACVLAAVALPGHAEVTLPAVFSQDMVLQRGMPLPVWGRAAAGEEVTVELAGHRAQATAATDGSWKAVLPPMEAGGPHVLTVQGANRIEITGVLVGEVWFCSGQSNMAFQLDRADTGKKVMATADDGQLRVFDVGHVSAPQPQFTAPGSWTADHGMALRKTSAVAYFFARKLRRDLGVPVGIIHSSWGGSAAESWTPLAVLEANADFQPILVRWGNIVRKYPEASRAFEVKKPELMAAYEKALAEAKAKGASLPRPPREPKGAPGDRDTPAGLYNAMVAPFIPYAIRGVAWYQGESNAGRAHQYRELFPALITAWRQAWGEGDFPFLFVQLPNLDREPDPNRSTWAELREAQRLTLQLPNTGMAVTIDLGNPRDIHPTNKLPVGERLALLVEGAVYGKESGDFTGPLYRSATVEGKAIRLAFDQASGGLEARGGGPLRGFEIAGANGTFSLAEARIEGQAVIVSSPEVPEPKAVRYDWADNPDGNLVNAADLPAAPFRTDEDFRWYTLGRR